MIKHAEQNKLGAPRDCQMPNCLDTTRADLPAEQLATPDQRPAADVVIYDGKCRFCIGQIQRLARWDRGGRLAFLSLHDPLIAQRYPDLSPEQLLSDMYVVDRRGVRHRGAAAWRYLACRLPRLWWLCPLLYLPGSLPLWQRLYRRIADRRYRLAAGESCDDGSCRVPGKP